MTKTLPSDLEIAQSTPMRPIAEIAAQLGIDEAYLLPYGRNVAKVDPAVAEAQAGRQPGKYIVVTAITPTPLGEGKTTTAVGLAQGLKHLDKTSVLTLRQPSMGPTFGIKGGAAGAGYSQVLPMETLNLHLTGDFHAVTAAHNMLAALIDNHIYHGNKLDLEPAEVQWRRVMDVNDRALRNVVIGLGSKGDGVPRQSGFDITAASEVMTTLALATSADDLRARLGRIVIGRNRSKQFVTAEDLGAAGAMAVILKDAVWPNLLQTTENTPVLIHCGPFGNIATGNSSVIADQVGLKTAQYVITEAGFGADMGAERFFNIKCRVGNAVPAAAVLVVTVRALKAHSGRFRIVPGKPLPGDMLAENPDDVRAGADNLRKHIEIVQGFGVQPVVAINAFPTDFASEHDAIVEIAQQCGVRSAVSTHVMDGGKGAVALAEQVVLAAEEAPQFKYTYALEMPLEDKIAAVATEVYGAADVSYSPAAATALRQFSKAGYGDLPVVIAKTHLSVSSDPKRKGAPTGWTLPVREVRLAAGAGYVYAIAGDMRTMPGLGASPAAERIDLDAEGRIVGLF
ncbi:MAG: formate--tetrahydrofolate ligase [Myxococcales bacterium]|jgi:formate--tetrahydrofolate ligase|nr:formate--tetrahydrofolate ligase [Myxococcales bacterium]